MTTIYSSLAPVKTTRRFGAGLLASLPTYRVAATAADMAWWAAQNAEQADDAKHDVRHDAGRDWDWEAGEAMAADQLGRGVRLF